MPDYEKMYHTMATAADEALTALESGETEKCGLFLRAGLLAAENVYVETSDGDEAGACNAQAGGL